MFFGLTAAANQLLASLASLAISSLARLFHR
jgi:hypothetical protein